MAWIKTIHPDDADGPVKRLYGEAVERSGKVWNIVRLMSLAPEQLEASMAFYRTIMFGPSELSRAEREMVATVVSSANRCRY